MEIKQFEKTLPDGSRAVYSGRLHSFNDRPAITRGKDIQYWYNEGILHRDGDKPAVLYEGNQMYLKHGVYHREGDKPAVLLKSGTMEWFWEGKRHRENGFPAVIHSKSTKKQDEYWVHGEQQNKMN